MKKILKQFYFVVFISLLLILPYFVFAGARDDLLGNVDYVAEGGGFSIDEVDEYSMSEMVGRIIESLLSLLGVVFVILLLYGGFKWMKASGREEDVKTAQAIIRQAIIGLIITTSAWTISRFVLAALTN